MVYPWNSNEHYMGLSENSVPLHPMVLLIIIPIKLLFHWEYTLFSDKPIYPSILYSDVQVRSSQSTQITRGYRHPAQRHPRLLEVRSQTCQNLQGM